MTFELEYTVYLYYISKWRLQGKVRVHLRVWLKKAGVCSSPTSLLHCPDRMYTEEHHHVKKLDCKRKIRAHQPAGYRMQQQDGILNQPRVMPVLGQALGETNHVNQYSNSYSAAASYSDS